jgi:hypothetical protein
MVPMRYTKWIEPKGPDQENRSGEFQPPDNPFDDHEVHHRIGELIARYASGQRSDEHH